MKTISIDFDGVIHDYSAGWTGYVPQGEPVPCAREFVRWCLSMGYEVVVSTCRAYTQIGRLAVREWLEGHGFPVERMQITCEKPHADWYVDDRAIRFEGDFAAVGEQMRRPVWFKAQVEPEFEQ